MKGKVIEENQNNMLKVKIVRAEACGNCKGCLAGQIETEMELDARNLCEAEIDDWVELELEDNAFFKAVVISYGIPFVFFVSGITLGHFTFAPYFPNLAEGLVSCITGFVFVLIAYAFLKSQNHKWESGGYTPLAVKLTEPEAELEEKLSCPSDS